MMKRILSLAFEGDNSAAEKVSKSGQSHQMSYSRRTSQISFSWACENIAPFLSLIGTDLNESDLFTKSLDKDKHLRFCRALGLYEDE